MLELGFSYSTTAQDTDMAGRKAQQGKRERCGINRNHGMKPPNEAVKSLAGNLTRDPSEKGRVCGQANHCSKIPGKIPEVQHER